MVPPGFSTFGAVGSTTLPHELCTGATWEISQGFGVLPRVGSTFLTSGVGYGSKLQTNCISVCTLLGSLLSILRFVFGFVVGHTVGALPVLVILYPLKTLKKLAVACFPARVYRHPSLRHLA